tara:strand:- start:321 stop:497 length:177 start_codon:yes stop_codon:yes gene_type:complete
METKYIDLTPSWSVTAQQLLAILEGASDPKNKTFARDEILRMGKIIDQLQSRKNKDEN